MSLRVLWMDVPSDSSRPCRSTLKWKFRTIITVFVTFCTMLGKSLYGFLYLKRVVSGRRASCLYVWLTNQSLIIPSILSKLLIYDTFVSVATLCKNIPSFCYSRLCHQRKYTKVGLFYLCNFLHDRNNEHWLFVDFSSQQWRAKRPLPHPRPPPPSQQGWMAWSRA